MSEHTPTPWFVSGVRFRMNGGEWQSINRYDESKKQDENIACVGYDPRTGVGFADAAFIVEAVNSHDALKSELEKAQLQLVKAQATVFFCEWLDGYFGGINRRDELTAFEANSIRAKLYGEVYPPPALTVTDD